MIFHFPTYNKSIEAESMDEAILILNQKDNVWELQANHDDTYIQPNKRKKVSWNK